MRILLVGDCHGNDRFFAQMCKLAAEEKCTHLVALGDFGYWEHYNEGKGYLKWCQRQLAEKSLVGYFLDGNHENHPLLWQLYGPGGPQYQPDNQGFWEIRPNLFYMPRSHRWTWDGITFLSLGGAYSIDLDYREEGKSWWATELITDEEVQRCLDGGPVDVMLTHDAPEGTNIPSLQGQQRDLFPVSRDNRRKVRKVVQGVKPKFLAHGHYHCRYSDTLAFRIGDDIDDWQVLRVEGLGADLSQYSNDVAFLFDTETFHALVPK